MAKISSLGHAYWAKKIEQWHATNKSAKAWCQEHNLTYTTFLGWRNRLSKKIDTLPSLEKATRASFVELEESPSLGAGIAIECKGFSIQLSKNFDDQTLLKCLQVVRGYHAINCR